MSSKTIKTTVSVCEDTDQVFQIADLLIQGGFNPVQPVNVLSVLVLQDGDYVAAPTSLFHQVGTDAVAVTGSGLANFNGAFDTLTVLVDTGANILTLELHVNIDPVNDAPSGADSSVEVVDGSPYALSESDFGFSDVIDGNSFQSVVITTPPALGTLLLNGSAVLPGTEVSAADLAAGHLTYLSAPGDTTPVTMTFQVRDNGGIDPDCGGTDLDATPNVITFQAIIPHALLGSIGDLVWDDANGNGVQDSGEAGVAGLAVTLTAAGLDGVVGTTDDITTTVNTDATGHYVFSDLEAGKYQVSFASPAGTVFTAQGAGADPELDSNVNASGQTGVITLGEGEGNLSVDAGVVRLGSIGDFVWDDANQNGVQDSGEGGVAGVMVVLASPGQDGQPGTGDDVYFATQTDAAGHYQFDHLTAGNYQLIFGNTIPGAVFTGQSQGGNASIDSDVDVNGVTAPIALGVGEHNNSIDAGLVLKGSIEARVWEDANGNGLQDSGETGVLGGVTVTLVGAGADGLFGTSDDSTTLGTTDSLGKVLFTGLDAGLYQYQLSDVPAARVYSPKSQGTDVTIDSDVNSTGLSDVITLAYAQNYADTDAGLVRLGMIGDHVWNDANANGLQDLGEAGLAGVTIKLTGAGADGILGTGDDTHQNTISDTHGDYLFENLAAGQYQLQFSGAPAGFVATSQNVGTNDEIDSDIDGTGTTAPITLGVGEINLNVDAGGFVRLGSIGDRVWNDANGNGVQDSGESGVAGVSVKLTSAGADGILGTADDASVTNTTNATGNYVFGGLAAGLYQVQFSNTPAGTAFTAQAQGGNAANDSNANSSGLTGAINLGWGEDNTSIDAGLVRLGSLGDRVWLDANSNGLQDTGETGVSGIAVKLISAGADGILGSADDTFATTTTNSSGAYLFSNLSAGKYQVQFSGVASGYVFTAQDTGTNDGIDSDVNSTGLSQVVTLGVGENNATVDAGIKCAPLGSIGDKVWNDTNSNGLQDTGESGVCGMTVKLIGAGTDGVFGTTDDTTVATATTSTSGAYLFSGLAAGKYQVQFGALAVGNAYTTQDVGTNDGIDSDANSAGRSQTVTLAAGENNLTVDAGVVCVPLGSIGDKVWKDANANGLQDTGEAGVCGVTVTLKGAGADGVFGTTDDTTLATTTTNTSGNYLFSNLVAGKYQVQFGSLAVGNLYTTQDVGTNDGIDSDVNSSGLSQVVTLTAGQNNLTVDAGIKTVALGSIGDKVWCDANGNGLQDTGEAGVCGVTVTLKGAGADGLLGTTDDTTATTTTNASGAYLFSNLLAGKYQVQFGAPSGYSFTGQDKGTSDTVDSDVNSSGLSQVVTLTAGQNNLTVDAGIVKQACATIVGADCFYEGKSSSYKVQLTSAVAVDTYITISASGGTAGRTSTAMATQEIIAGGTYDVRDASGHVTKVYTNLIPNSLTSTTAGNHAATGPANQSADYGLYGSDGVIDADGIIQVKIAAGSTTSAAFSVNAWQEKVYADLDLFPNGGYKEAAWETLNLNVTAVGNSLVSTTCAAKTVQIGDTTCYQVFSPIAIDLDGNGIHTTALIDSKGTFDLLGTGKAIHSGWLSAGDAFLAIDSNGNGRIDGISELFGGKVGDGFAKLASFDTDHNGVVDARDADFSKLLVWQDSNGNHATDAGELRTLGEAGLASLNVSNTMQSEDQLGNVLGERSSATRADGTQAAVVDVYFNYDPADAALPHLGSVLSASNGLLDGAFGTQIAATDTSANAPVLHTSGDEAEALRRLTTLAA